MMTPKELVEELRALALTDKWSQSEIARALHVDRQRVNGWFTQGRIPNAEYALRIQALLASAKRRAQRARQKG